MWDGPGKLCYQISHGGIAVKRKVTADLYIKIEARARHKSMKLVLTKFSGIMGSDILPDTCFMNFSGHGIVLSFYPPNFQFSFIFVPSPTQTLIKTLLTIKIHRKKSINFFYVSLLLISLSFITKETPLILIFYPTKFNSDSIKNAQYS